MEDDGQQTLGATLSHLPHTSSATRSQDHGSGLRALRRVAFPTLRSLSDGFVPARHARSRRYEETRDAEPG